MVTQDTSHPKKSESSIKEIKELLLSANPEADIPLLEKANAFAHKAHKGQMRKSGLEYITHPLAVTKILAKHKFDTATLSASLLHDVIEDCEVTEAELTEEFGEEICELVSGVTKISTLAPQTKHETQTENMRRMLVAIAKDVRVLLIKLADRLHNMRTISHLDRERIERLSRETLEIYAPLANHMGMNTFQIELEDLAFKNLEPEKYKAIQNGMETLLGERQKLMQEATKLVEYQLNSSGIKATVSHRQKEIYSVFRKMERQNAPMSQIFDLLAMRLLVHTVRDCYDALGTIHTIWKPIPRRFKDYIAMPKTNMYQSLHTTVIGPGDGPLEIQIKTREMHLNAEEGIAAHWKYKSDEPVDDCMGWLKQILDWQRDAVSAKDFMDSLRSDLFSDQVFVITPKGDIYELSAGSTPIDVAFRIHTEVGRHIAGARVDGKIVPITTALKSGQVIDIITSPSAKPSRDWLDVVKSSRARQKIRQILREEGSDDLRRHGATVLQNALDRNRILLSVSKPSRELVELSGAMHYQDLDALLESIGFGTESAESIVRRLKPADDQTPAYTPRRRTKPNKDSAIEIEGHRDFLTRFSGCCTPIPGDDIIGYLSRGRAVTIHRVDCPTFKNLDAEQARFVDAKWTAQSGPYVAKILVECDDRVGGLADVSTAIAKHAGNIISAEIKTQDIGRNFFLVEVVDTKHLEKILKEIEKVKGVLHARRSRMGNAPHSSDTSQPQ
ncbi:MAG: bifunctional (p)ppGpp synthetase/guanosine-3',5'-bis(diphosphate) 3'-pyrophosphohydrolase [Candidatus Lindowbacteria bacterium]|nr:bifunctional (p)ppGpp synthetase/guanosine-3',5'-bis(diphosphate) 3'-pyrophosphohydrolase [Candidatus Lindowbacteria bacterium]